MDVVRHCMYLFKFPFEGYGYAICGGPDNSVLAPIGEWIFIWTTPHNRDASDSKKATCVSDAPSKMQLKRIYYMSTSTTTLKWRWQNSIPLSHPSNHIAIPPIPMSLTTMLTINFAHVTIFYFNIWNIMMLTMFLMLKCYV